eukprot:3579357-Rhodomonas_salina.2
MPVLHISIGYGSTARCIAASTAHRVAAQLVSVPHIALQKGFDSGAQIQYRTCLGAVKGILPTEECLDSEVAPSGPCARYKNIPELSTTGLYHAIQKNVRTTQRSVLRPQASTKGLVAVGGFAYQIKAAA